MLQSFNSTLAAIAMVVFLSSAAVAQTPQDIVSSFYPQKLIDTADPGDSRTSCFVNYDSRTIVAGYSNSVRGDVLVIQSGANNQWNVVYESNNMTVLGTGCTAKLIDLTGDGINEIVVSFFSLRGNTMDWIFTWNGSVLTSIGPTTHSHGLLTSAAMNSDFIDLYHSGTVQIVSSGKYPPPADGSLPVVAATLYALSNGSFKRFANPILFEESIRLDSAVEGFDLSFAKPTTIPPPYTINVVNGDHVGQRRVSSGTVTLNGQVVIQPPIVNSATEFSKITVQLENQNTMHVDLTGVAGNTVLLEIEGQPSGDLNLDGVVDCSDIQIVAFSFGKQTGQSGFDPRADVNADGVVNVIDQAIVSRQLAAGTVCK